MGNQPTGKDSGIWDNHGRGTVGEFLRDTLISGADLSVVSAFFTIYAYDKLSRELEDIGSLRFLFGEPKFVLDPDGSEAKAFDVEERQLKLRGRLKQKNAARRCADWLRNKAEIRSVKQAGFVHGKMLHVKKPNDTEAAMIGSSNFTLRGLGLCDRPNIELNLELNDRRDIRDLLAWFEEVWDSEHTQDVKEDVLRYLERLYSNTSPEFVYFLTLYHIFERYLRGQDQAGLLEQQIGFFDTAVWNMLYPFQKHGVTGAINKILCHNGCIIADSVGLGKTFEALAVIKYFELRNSRVLVLCPKRLYGNWATYRHNVVRNVLAEDRFQYDILAHTDLTRTTGASDSGIDLGNVNWGNYDLVVIDESHNFRNSSYGREDDEGGYHFTRYERLMEEVLKKGVNSRVLLLSATPVNNHLRDLRNQIYLITQQIDDALRESADIVHIGNTVNVAEKQYRSWAAPSNPRPLNVTDLLDRLDSGFFKLLDQLTIARSRKHIEKHYDLASIGRFPERLAVQNETPGLDLANQFPSYERIDAELSNLKLALYNPSAYVPPAYRQLYDIKDQRGGKGSFDDQQSRESFLIGMMKVNLLKRLESSVHSFWQTLDRLLNKIDSTLDKIQHFEENRDAYVQPDFFDEMEEDEQEEYRDKLEVGSKLKFQLKHIDLKTWESDLRADRDQVLSILNNAKAVDAKRDAKLNRLRKIIAEKQQQPVNDGNKKLLIFTAFADTAKYLYDHLHPWAKDELDLHAALVSGGAGENKTSFVPKGFEKQRDFEAILTNFSPRSKDREKMPNMPQDDEIDLLIATDCISEGQNLQDCDCVVNYDIHWNPVRIIQRFGRIDRLGSTNESIKQIHFWPTSDLDQYIRLRHRVEARMALVAITATGDDPLQGHDGLTDGNGDDQDSYRDKQIQRLQNEVLDLEDLEQDISLSEFTLDDFRVDLLNYLEANREALQGAPLGLYAVVPTPKPTNLLPGLDPRADIHKTARSGVIFCLRQSDSADGLEQVNPLQPYFLVYIRDDGGIRYNFTHAKQILTLFQALCMGRPDPYEALCDAFDRETGDGSDMSRYDDLLSKAVDAVVSHFRKRDLRNLFKGRGGKLVQQDKRASKLDDFDLITWLVIKDPEETQENA